MSYVLKPLAPEAFVETSVSRQIRIAVDYAQQRRRPVLVTGRAGVGKSTGLWHIYENDPRACYIQISNGQYTLSQFVNAMLALFNLTAYQINTHDRLERVYAYLPDLVAEGRYLIIDEFQNLALSAINLAQKFSENFGMPVVMVGNAARLKRTKADAHFLDQIDDRFAMVATVDDPRREDFLALASVYNVEEAAHEALVAIGLQTSMRQAAELLGAARASCDPDRPIGVEFLERMRRFLKPDLAANPAASRLRLLADA